jgi:hypothetical protein
VCLVRMMFITFLVESPVGVPTVPYSLIPKGPWVNLEGSLKARCPEENLEVCTLGGSLPVESTTGGSEKNSREEYTREYGRVPHRRRQPRGVPRS